MEVTHPLKTNEPQPGEHEHCGQQVQLGDCAWSSVGSLHALAVDDDLPDLASATDWSRTDLTHGSATNVINRCRDVHRLATENSVLLKDDDLTAADIAALRQCSDAFEALLTKPRKTKARARRRARNWIPCSASSRSSSPSGWTSTRRSSRRPRRNFATPTRRAAASSIRPRPSRSRK